MPAEVTDQHLDQCPACQTWQARASALTRSLRVRPAEPTPDLVEAVLEVAVIPTPMRGWWARAALVVVAVAQLTLGMAEVLGVNQGMSDMPMSGHLFNESTAWNLALGIGMLWAALRTRAIAGMLPVMSGFLLMLTAFSVHDLLNGGVTLSRVSSHGLLVVGLGLLYVVHRGHADGTAPVPGTANALPSSSADTTTVTDDSTVRPATRQAGGRPPLRPAGHHKAA